jgi:SPP1 family predicted phage head-tail adaptor
VNAVPIGQLRHRVEVQRRNRTADGYGGWTNTWETKGYFYARVEPVSAREALFAMQLDHRITHRVTMRYCENPDISPMTDDRIVHKGRTFNIMGVRDIEERIRYFQLDCEEGGAN